MARIQIELPDRFAFATELAIYLSHISNAGHLENAMLLTLVSEARSRFFKFLGYAELDVEGVGIVVADAALQYRSEAFHGEIMQIQMAAVDFSQRGCDLVWQMKEKQSGREVARGKTGIVFYDYTTRRVTDIPPGFRARLT